MIIDRQSLRDSRWWIVISLAVLIFCTAGYFLYAATAPMGPSGGSWQGLTFAGVGTAIIVFAWALTVRKWRRSARVGRTYTWLQGHVYLSLVSYWVILYHAGFHWGGPLTRVLMWAFTVCYFSGILLLIAQQVVPRLLLSDVPLETIYEQVDHVSRQNLAAADELIEKHAAVVATVPDLDDEDFETGRRSRGAAQSSQADLRAFYDRRVRPFLAQDLQPAGRGPRVAVLGAWASAGRRAIFPGARATPPMVDEFADLRRKLPDGLHGVLAALEGFTEERRQFILQKRLQHILHGWLLIHVPSSWVMIVLLPLHAVQAFRYL